MVNTSILSLLAIVGLASAQGPIIPCTSTITKFASIDESCTVPFLTITDTSYTDCHGCILETQTVGGPGPVRICSTTVTAPTPAFTEVTSCYPSSTLIGRAVPTCTVTRLPSIGPLSSATCTYYESTVTDTVSSDCTGCATVTRGGPGPVVQCGTTTNLPVTTATVTACY